MSDFLLLMIGMIAGVNNCRMAWGPCKNYCCLFISNDLCQCTSVCIGVPVCKCSYPDCNLLDKSFLRDWCLSAHVGIYLIDCHKNNNSKKLLINMISGIFLPLTSFVQPARKLIQLTQAGFAAFHQTKETTLIELGRSSKKLQEYLGSSPNMGGS